jgi:hypothetical protein
LGSSKPDSAKVRERRFWWIGRVKSGEFFASPAR